MMARAPAFWRRRPPTFAARLLQPAGWVYGAVTAWRMARPGARASVPVICVGNMTVGGTGKTPVAIHVATLLQRMGERPVFLSRGYGGALSGPIRVDSDVHIAAQVGDEPLLLVAVAPVIVSRDKVAGAQAAVAAGATVIVMDDGLQNPSLHKDLAICVVDAASGNGNGLVFPAGPLRAPPALQSPQIDAVVALGDGVFSLRDVGLPDALPVLRARLEPEAAAAGSLSGKAVHAIAGIGQPQKFVDTLHECGAQVVGRTFVGDHEPYSDELLRAAMAEASANGAVIATTRKDWVRLTTAQHSLLSDALVVDVRLAERDADAWAELIGRRLKPA
jgi:tetraacyldisaccharide 4'-kinase